MKEPSDGIHTLLAVRDAGMFDSGCRMPQKMPVVRYDNTTLAQGKRHVLKIVCRKKTCVRSRYDVDPMAS